MPANFNSQNNPQNPNNSNNYGPNHEFDPNLDPNYNPNFDPNYNPNYNPNFDSNANANTNFVQTQAQYDPNGNLITNLDPNFDPNYNPNQNLAYDNSGLEIPGNYDSNEQIQPEEPSVAQKIVNFIIVNWIVILVVTLILAIVLIGGSIFLGNLGRNRNSGTSVSANYQNVSVQIKGPETLAQGTPADWEVQVENFEAVPLINVKVELEFDRFFVFVKEYNPRPDNPEGSIYTIPRLDPKGSRGSSAIIRFQGFLNGNVDLEPEMGGKVSYSPQLSQTDFAPIETVGIKKVKTKITSPQIKVTLDPTNPQVQNGGEAEFTVLINNTTDSEIRDLRLRMIYPGNKETFTYVPSITALPIRLPKTLLTMATILGLLLVFQLGQIKLSKLEVRFLELITPN
jgi:hypothetical protein